MSQFGITWTFDTTYTTGQFANGDYWVVGPVKIIDISPPSTDTGGRTKNGSMLNPTPRDRSIQGYDSAMADNTYSADRNVALGISPSKPLAITPNAALVSTISIDAAGNRPQIKTAAILTVVDKVPEAWSFRPAYCGDHEVRFKASQLLMIKLKKLPLVAGTPALAAIERSFERPWLDHIPTWNGREAHPADNMPDYGRDMSDAVGRAALMLHLNFTNQEKITLVVCYVQLGIDLFGIVADGGQENWTPNGGHASGRKFPILFAGAMLGDEAMSNIGQDTVTLFGEDAQTFYVRETSPGVYNNGHGGYGRQHKDKAEYGIRHATDPSRDDASWDAPYRTCCTANAWGGFVLAARIMGLHMEWNHAALFDYQDFYVAEARRQNGPASSVSWSNFPLAMWDAYRAAY